MTELPTMNAKKDFDYLFRGQIANLPLTPEWVRTNFERWWAVVCERIDERNKEVVLAHVRQYNLFLKESRCANNNLCEIRIPYKYARGALLALCPDIKSEDLND